MVVKKRIEGKNYVKGTHLNPELRKEQDPELRKEQDPELRKEQNPELRKKQDPQLRKNPDQSGWTKTTRVQSELQQECQERFTKLGGEGIVSPPKAKALCKDYTRWCRGDPKVGVRGINTAKCKRWKALPCHRRLSLAMSKWQLLQSRSGNCGRGWPWPWRRAHAPAALAYLLTGQDVFFVYIEKIMYAPYGTIQGLMPLLVPMLASARVPRGHGGHVQRNPGYSKASGAHSTTSGRLLGATRNLGELHEIFALVP
jgi:hypothetical protein